MRTLGRNPPAVINLLTPVWFGWTGSYGRQPGPTGPCLGDWKSSGRETRASNEVGEIAMRTRLQKVINPLQSTP